MPFRVKGAYKDRPSHLLIFDRMGMNTMGIGYEIGGWRVRGSGARTMRQVADADEYRW